MAVSLVNQTAAQITSLPIQTDPIYLGELGLFFLGSAAVLFISFAARSLMKNTHRELFQPRNIGSFIVVLVMVCVPITLVSFAAQNSGAGIEVVVLSILPIFTAGLALEERAEHLVAQAQQEALGRHTAGDKATGKKNNALQLH